MGKESWSCHLHLDGSFNASEFGVLFSLLVLIMCACRYGCLKQSVKLRNFKKMSWVEITDCSVVWGQSYVCLWLVWCKLAKWLAVLVLGTPTV